MKRLTQLFSPALTRLAFWRRPAPTAEAAELPPAPLPAPLTESAPAGGDAPELIDAAETETPATAPEPPAMPEPAMADGDLEPSPPSFFARLMARLRRRPAAEVDEAEADTPAYASADEASPDSAPAPRGMQRLRALLTRKIVWIPAASLTLLAIVGTLSVLLWQSGQDKAALQAKLEAAEQELEKTVAVHPPAADLSAADLSPATPASPAAETALAAADTATLAPPSPRRNLSGSDCDINDAASVSLRLKDCIDSFNQETARTRPAQK